jgi:hypothetical protein
MNSKSNRKTTNDPHDCNTDCDNLNLSNSLLTESNRDENSSSPSADVSYSNDRHINTNNVNPTSDKPKRVNSSKSKIILSNKENHPANQTVEPMSSFLSNVWQYATRIPNENYSICN